MGMTTHFCGPPERPAESKRNFISGNLKSVLLKEGFSTKSHQTGKLDAHMIFVFYMPLSNDGTVILSHALLVYNIEPSFPN
jgi:hypothetical protein